MTRVDVKYYADCLKNNKRIDFNTMNMFCNEVIDSQNKLQKIENIIERTQNSADLEYFFEEIVEVMND